MANHVVDRGTDRAREAVVVERRGDGAFGDDVLVTDAVQFSGGDAYLHVGYANFFFDAEYMAALDNFAPFEIVTVTGQGAQPRVWNFEFGYNWDWGKNLEIALKYEGSDESEALGFPERRYGIGFNQTVFDGVVASLGYFRDDYHEGDADGRDKRDIVFGQLAVEF